jgi:hypothetical protein
MGTVIYVTDFSKLPNKLVIDDAEDVDLDGLKVILQPTAIVNFTWAFNFTT